MQIGPKDPTMICVGSDRMELLRYAATNKPRFPELRGDGSANFNPPWSQPTRASI